MAHTLKARSQTLSVGKLQARLTDVTEETYKLTILT